MNEIKRILILLGVVVFSLLLLGSCDMLFGSDDDDDDPEDFELRIFGGVEFDDDGNGGETVNADLRLLWKDSDEPYDEPDQFYGSFEVGGTSYPVEDLFNAIQPILDKIDDDDHDGAVSDFENLAPPDYQWAFRVIFIIHGFMEGALPPEAPLESGITVDIDEDAMEGEVVLDSFPQNVGDWEGPDGFDWVDFLSPFWGGDEFPITGSGTIELKGSMK